MIRDKTHLDWVKEQGHYNFRFDMGKDGYLPMLLPDFAKAQLMMLFRTNGEPIPHLWKIREQFIEVDKDELEAAYHYPRPPTGKRYLLFPLEIHHEEIKWDRAKLELYYSWPTVRAHIGRPFQLTLKQVISSYCSV